jgi:hypothetical protein
MSMATGMGGGMWPRSKLGACHSCARGSAHAGSGVELDANRWLGAWWWRRLTRARWLWLWLWLWRSDALTLALALAIHVHVHVDAEAAGVRSRGACVEPGRPAVHVP